jgi:hypothetical protein
MDKSKKNWFMKNVIWITGLIILIGIILFGFPTTSNKTAVIEGVNKPVPAVMMVDNSKTVLTSKTSGFTLEECKGFCDKVYDHPVEIGKCKSTCQNSEDGSSLDNFCLATINVWRMARNVTA